MTVKSCSFGSVVLISGHITSLECLQFCCLRFNCIVLDPCSTIHAGRGHWRDDIVIYEEAERPSKGRAGWLANRLVVGAVVASAGVWGV